MPKTRTITLDISEPRTSLWCDTCLLPSAFEFDINHLRTSGVTTVSTLWRCTGCGGRQAP